MSPASRRQFLAAGGVLSAGLLTGTAATAAAPAPANAADFTDLVIDCGDVILAAREIGSGDLVLIHPSLGRGARDFDPLALLLAAGGYRVVSFDPRGIGQSTAPEQTLANLTLHDYAADMLAVLNALGVSRAHLVGHAYGNRVARTLATDHPEVARSVTLCACGDGSPGLPAEVGIDTVIDPTTPTAKFKPAVKSTFFAPTSDPTPWYVGWYDIGANAQQLAAERTPSSQFQAGGTAPMLIIQGLDDIVAPPSIGQGLKSMYGSRVELYDLADCAHALIIERTDAVADVMLTYLAKFEPQHDTLSVALRVLGSGSGDKHVMVEVTHSAPLTAVELRLNGQLLERTRRARFARPLPAQRLRRGRNELAAAVWDDLGHKAMTVVRIDG
jgi:pimeloyl-ACP methyl ester carboxylesterase